MKLTNDNLLDHTLRTWQPRSSCELDRKDAQEIVKNAAGFFSLLAKWAQTEISPSADENDWCHRDTDDQIHHDG